jgi:branched-chain amino acid transport system ATP-binding protein
MILSVENTSRSFGGFLALNNVNLQVTNGEMHALIGPNGAGKTTLFNVISGLISADVGKIRFKGKELTRMKPHQIVEAGMARSFQRVNVFPRNTAFENVQVALIARNKQHFNIFAGAHGKYAEQVMELLQLVGMADDASIPASELAHGKQKQLELAVALAAEPDLLLLDEPTAGMSISETVASIELIRDIVQGRNLTLLFTEHDMTVVFEIADRISVLHHGEIIATGDGDAVRDDPEVRRVYLGKDELKS